MGGKNGDFYVAPQLYYFLLLHQKPQALYAARGAQTPEVKADMRRPQGYAGGAKHKCAVCGRTELDDPTLEFRFCSKCEGNYEYCQDHLFTHQHIRMS